MRSCRLWARTSSRKFLPDAELAAGELDGRLPGALDLVEIAGEVLHHVRRIARRRDGRHGPDFGDFAGRCQHGGAAEAVADENGRRLVLLTQPVGGAHEILHIGTEIGVGELALARAEPGEVEAQCRDAELAQPAGDARCGKNCPWSR
jgi:hypothetical protein